MKNQLKLIFPKNVGFDFERAQIFEHCYTGLIRVKEEGQTGFPRAGRAAPRDIPGSKPGGNTKEQL